MSRLLVLALLLAFCSSPLFAQPEFVRGDADGDSVVDMGDVLRLLGQLKIPGTPPLDCPAAGDADNSGAVNGLVDALSLLNTLFLAGGNAIAQPYPDCGLDPENDFLDCFVYDCDAVPDNPFDPDLVLRFEDAVGVAGNITEIRLLLDNTSTESVHAFQWGVCDVGPGAVVTDMQPGADFVAASEHTGFAGFQVYDGEGWTGALLLDFISVGELDPGVDLEIARATYSVSEAGSYTIELCDGLGEPPITTLVAQNFGGEKILPDTGTGTLTVSPGFLRGDADGNGAVTIADPLFVLDFAYTGGAEPGCLDAADMDDDGLVNGVADALFGLGGLFSGGPPLPAPGMFDCGIDPTDDDLGCLAFENCP